MERSKLIALAVVLGVLVLGLSVALAYYVGRSGAVSAVAAAVPAVDSLARSVDSLEVVDSVRAVESSDRAAVSAREGGALPAEYGPGTEVAPAEVYESSEEAKIQMQLYEMEIKDDTIYLGVKQGFVRRRILDNCLVVNGWVVNRARVAGFSDVRVEVSYLSKTGSNIGGDSFTLYDYVPANNSVDFREVLCGCSVRSSLVGSVRFRILGSVPN